MSEEVTYELATARWRRTGTVQIISILDTDIADFPITFLASCGDNTWQYILHVVHQLVNPVSDHPGILCVADEDGENEQPVTVEEPPSAGLFRYKQQGM